jgi:hypothetical protein
MTEERLALTELLEKAGEGDFLRAVAEAVLQLLMEADVEGLIGAGRYERSGERSTWRNGYRERTLDTRLGSLQLRIPKLRQGSYFPPFLEARKSSEKALVAVIQEAWIGGVSTRRVDDLVQAMGLSGISKSQVSKLCKEIDERVHAFLDRPLAGAWPYLWLDATYLKQREGGRIVSVAAIIAVAANKLTTLVFSFVAPVSISRWKCLRNVRSPIGLSHLLRTIWHICSGGMPRAAIISTLRHCSGVGSKRSRPPLATILSIKFPMPRERKVKIGRA